MLLSVYDQPVCGLVPDGRDLSDPCDPARQAFKQVVRDIVARTRPAVASSDGAVLLNGPMYLRRLGEALLPSANEVLAGSVEGLQVPHPLVLLRNWLEQAKDAALQQHPLPTFEDHVGKNEVEKQCDEQANAAQAAFNTATQALGNVDGFKDVVAAVRQELDQHYTHGTKGLVTRDATYGEKTAGTHVESETRNVSAVEKRFHHRVKRKGLFQSGLTKDFYHNYVKRQVFTRTVETLKNGQVKTGPWTPAQNAYEVDLGYCDVKKYK
jgi:hypothetical protein